MGVFERSFADCLVVLDEVCAELSASADGTRCFRPIDERWHPTNAHHTVEDVRRWFAALDPAHPAHQERVPLNHPRAIISPPYFDDLPEGEAPAAATATEDATAPTGAAAPS
jgi:hypothetical protein